VFEEDFSPQIYADETHIENKMPGKLDISKTKCQRPKTALSFRFAFLLLALL